MATNPPPPAAPRHRHTTASGNREQPAMSSRVQRPSPWFRTHSGALVARVKDKPHPPSGKGPSRLPSCGSPQGLRSRGGDCSPEPRRAQGTCPPLRRGPRAGSAPARPPRCRRPLNSPSGAIRVPTGKSNPGEQNWRWSGRPRLPGKHAVRSVRLGAPLPSPGRSRRPRRLRLYVKFPSSPMHESVRPCSMRSSPSRL